MSIFSFFSPLSDTTRVWSRHVRNFLRWDFNEHVGYFSESSSASRFNTFRSAPLAHRTCSRTLKHILPFNPPQHSLPFPRVPGFSHDKNNEMHSVECSRRPHSHVSITSTWRNVVARQFVSPFAYSFVLFLRFYFITRPPFKFFANYKSRQTQANFCPCRSL